ncbi:unnamed protein product [Urochloa decumbens]|uniref:F-box domain-containing protein n=2 Tax=Urochloa decumbens TaxID=240449 RepID=A0ABC9FL82_9POAL
MAMVPGTKRRRLGEDDEEELVEDRISRLPDGVLGDIVSLLPTKDGARTQVLSSRWRHLWRAAPLNFDLSGHPAADVSRILAAHPGPCRRFSFNMFRVNYNEYSTVKANLDSWLLSPSLNNLQELEFLLGTLDNPPPLLPAPVRRFSPTLRVATFERCSFPDSALHLPLLQQLSLVRVRISETSLHALLAGCSVLESLLLVNNNGFLPRLQIVSASLRSIGVASRLGDDRLKQLIIEDAPCLERLLFFETSEIVFQDSGMDISVISAPRLRILGGISSKLPRLQFGTTTFQGASMVSLTTVVHSVKVLALSYVTLSLDVVIDLIKCFPCLEKLYIQTDELGEKNTWCRKYQNLIGTFDIRLKKIVVSCYRGNKSHVNFAKFFVSNAPVLESMRFEIQDRNINCVWIERQHRLLQIENRASRDAQFYFVSRNKSIESFISLQTRPEQVHDLSTAELFERIYN